MSAFSLEKESRELWLWRGGSFCPWTGWGRYWVTNIPV